MSNKLKIYKVVLAGFKQIAVKATNSLDAISQYCAYFGIQRSKHEIAVEEIDPVAGISSRSTYIPGNVNRSAIANLAEDKEVAEAEEKAKAVDAKKAAIDAAKLRQVDGEKINPAAPSEKNQENPGK